jgi:3-isopropylmalate/(R)-2-methylmalate dehydratase small subunit
VLPVVLDRAVVETLAREVEASQGAGRVSVDLWALTVTAPSGKCYAFALAPQRRQALLEGLDEIAITLKRAPEITAFQDEDRRRRPWVHEL